MNGNVAGTTGGGLSQESGGETVTLTGVTFSDNRAEDGGALYVRGSAEIVGSTVVGNRDDSSGGAIYKQGGGEVRLRNSVFSDNLTNGSENTGFGNLVSDGFNVFSDDAGGVAVDGSTDRVNTDAGLLSLADNGGPVQTHATAEGSPLINAGGGSAAATDATGQPVDGVPDIGAYESRAAADVVWLVDESGKLLRAPGDLAYVQTLSDGLSSPGDLVADIDGGRLHWLEDAGSKFVHADLDGENRQRLDIPGEPATSIALDTVNGYLLIAHGGAEPRIDRVPLATPTATPTTLVASGLHSPRALEVRGSGAMGDPVRVYWAEQGGGGIARAIRSASATTGDDVETHIDASDGIAGFASGEFDDLAVDADADDFYWVDRTEERIVGHSTVDGTSDERDAALPGFHAVELLEKEGEVLYATSRLANHGIGSVDEDALSGGADQHAVDDKVLSIATARTVVAGASAPPVATVSAVQGVDEGEGETVSVFAASGDGIDATALSWEVVTAPSHGRFELAGSEVTRFTQDDVDAGRVVYRHDGTENHADTATLVVDDGTNRSVPVTLTIDVEPTNDAPTGIALDAVTVAENAAGATIGGLTTSDPDAGDTASYTVADARFAIVGDELQLAGGVSLDFESTPSVDVEVVAKDADGATVSETFTLTVTDANEAPTAIGTLADQRASTGQPFILILPTTPWSDPDAGDTLTLAVRERGGGPLPAWLAFDPVSDELTGTPPGGALGELRLEVVASDGDGASAAPLDLLIDVIDGNGAPTGIALDPATVAENAAGATIGGLTTSDPDAGDTASYAVADARFAIVGDELQLAGGVSLDFEATPSVDVEIVATDSGGASRRETFTVSIGDLNEAPTGIALDVWTVAENAPGATIGRLTASDPDAGETASYAVASDARFEIVGDELKLVDGQSLDFESTPGVDVEVVANDSGGATYRGSVSFSVSDANDAPLTAIPPPDVALGPNGSYTLPAEAFSDPDGDPLVVTAASLPGWAGFDSASRTVVVTDVDAAAADPAGASAGARFVASDGRGGSAVLDATLRYEPGETVPDTVPPLAREDRFALREGDTLVVDDATRSLLANDTADEARAPLSARLVDGPAHGTLTLAADGTFRYEHGGGEQLVDSFSYRVGDGSGALSAPVEVTLVIESVNDVPLAVRDIGAQTVREGETLALVVDASNWLDPDVGDSVSVTVETVNGEPPPAWLAYDAERGVLAGTPDRGDVGTVELRFIARDASGAAARPLDVRIDVVDVNEPPDGIVLASEGVLENAFGAFVGQLSASDPDAGDTVRFTVADARFAISGDRLFLNPATALDFETNALVSVDVTATDADGASIGRTLDVRVLDGNDAPLLTALEQPAESMEGLRYAVPDTAFVDADGDALSYRATRVDGEALPDWLAFDAEARTFTITSPAATADAELTVDVRLFAEDGRGGTAFADLTFRREPPPELGSAEPVSEQVEPLLEPIVTTLAPPTASSVAASGEAAPAAEGPADAGTDESPRQTAQSPAQDELPELLVVDRLGTTTIDLHALLADAEHDSGALELIDVSRAIDSDLLAATGRFVQTDIDTVDLGALIDGSAALARRTFGGLADTLDAERDELDERAALARTLAGSSAGITSGLSVGYLLWLVRGGTLMGSVLSSLPAWRFVDPLPVLGSLADGIDVDADDESLETLVAGQAEPGS